MDMLPLLGALAGGLPLVGALLASLPDVREVSLPAWREKSFSGEDD
jgi:hypothetical protein